MESMNDELPGTPHHRQILRALVAAYADDPRVRAIIVFGSLGRGNWDAYSDLDLDVITTDDVQIIAATEAWRLDEAFQTSGERPGLVIPNGDEEVDIVLLSGTCLSIRYHPLASTSPNIVASMRVLSGALDPETIRAAAARTTRVERIPDPLPVVLDACIRAVVETRIAIARNRPWMAVELLHRIRGLMMELYSRTRGETRAVHAFEALASSDLQSQVAATIATHSIDDARRALAAAVSLLEHDLSEITNGVLSLNDHHHALLSLTRETPRVSS
jgi:predicted nucleotidyltransferase